MIDKRELRAKWQRYDARLTELTNGESEGGSLIGASFIIARTGVSDVLALLDELISGEELAAMLGMPDPPPTAQEVAKKAKEILAGERVARVTAEVELEARDERLLRILARASNVVEISWSLPEQVSGSLVDTLVASIVALGEALKP